MKLYVVAIVLLFSVLEIAQDSMRVTTPKNFVNLNFGTAFKSHDVEVRFIEVLLDSRCPKEVDCIWAGEAVVLVNILKEGKFLKQQKLCYSPSSHLQSKFANIFKSPEVNITGLNIMPYPDSGSKIKESDYYLQLEISN